MKCGPGFFIQGCTSSGSAAALERPATVAPDTSAPSRKMRRLSSPLPAAGSSDGDVLRLSFMTFPPVFHEDGGRDPIAKAARNATMTNARNRRFWNKFPFPSVHLAFSGDRKISFILYYFSALGYP